MFNTAKVLLCAALLAGTFWLSGCAGEEDHRYRSTSTTKLLEIFLNVATPDGRPLEGATVWVDGSVQPNRTRGTYQHLDSRFPPDWRGWQYNWFGGPFRFDLRDTYSRTVNIEILVSKTGWRTQRSTIPISRSSPDDIAMRQTFVMQREVRTYAVPTVVDATEPPELISLSDPAWQPEPSVEQDAE